MLSVTEINDAEQLAGYRLLWNALLPQTPGASFFQSLDWLEAYWRHFGAQQRLRVLIVHSHGQAVGILPLVVRTESTRLGSVRTLTYPLHDWGTFFGPIGHNTTATLLAGLGHVRRTERDWDVLDLRWIDETGTDRGRTRAALDVARLPAAGQPWAKSAQIDLTPGWDKYWATRTSRWRNNVRRSEKKLAEQGAVGFLRYRPDGAARGDGDPRWDLYEACERIAEDSWQGQSTTGTTLTHDSVRDFLRDAHLAAARAGALDMNLLLLDGQPVAFNYAYHYRGYVFGLRTGFVADPAADGAGSVLQMHMIRDSCALQDRVYDLGADYLDCKRYWQTHVRESYHYAHFPPKVPRAQLIRAKRWICRRLDAFKASGK